LDLCHDMEHITLICPEQSLIALKKSSVDLRNRVAIHICL